MKKSQYMALGLSMVLALSACGGETAPEPEEPKQEVQQVEPVSIEAPPIETEPEAEPEDTEPADMQMDEAEDNETPPVEEVQTVDLFTTVNETVYATGAVNLRSGPGTTFDKIGSLATGDSATRTGIGTGEAENWSRIKLESGEEVYISSNYLSLTRPPVQQAQPVNASSGGSGGSGTQQAQEASSEVSSSYDEDMAAFLKELEESGYANLDIDMSGVDYSPESTSKAHTNGWTETYR